MSDIVWTDPPGPTFGSQLRNERIVAELKTRPGEWALVATGIYNGFPAVLKRRGLETASRNQKNGKCDVYARWPKAAS